MVALVMRSTSKVGCVMIQAAFVSNADLHRQPRTLCTVVSVCIVVIDMLTRPFLKAISFSVFGEDAGSVEPTRVPLAFSPCLGGPWTLGSQLPLNRSSNITLGFLAVIFVVVWVDDGFSSSSMRIGIW